jgi:predicted N-acetyltransferase YhbS
MLFRPAHRSDIDEVCMLLATSRQPPEQVHAMLVADPSFDPAQIRLAWTGGRIVACARIYRRTLRIGTASVLVGGIGNLRTDPRHWRQGLASSLLGECLVAMYLEGMVLSPLFAARHTLFARRGWHVMPEPVVEIPAAALIEAKGAGSGPISVRPFEGGDLDSVAALHESANAGRTGTVVRDQDLWRERLTVLDMQDATALVAECEGEVVGFAWAQPRKETVELLELLLAPWAEEVWVPLLATVAIHHTGTEMLRATLPADYLGRVQALLADHAVVSMRDDLMLRIVDPGQLLGALGPLLAARLRDIGPVAPLALRIGPLRGGTVLRLAGNELTIERPRREDPWPMPEADFLALLLGAPHGLAHLTDLPEAARRTLSGLFPPQDWVYWRSDAY